jgi:hypothetical protein
MEYMPPKNLLGHAIPIKVRRLGLQILVICFFLQIPLAAWSGDNLTKEKIPNSLNPVFEHLNALNNPDGTQAVDSKIINDLAAFVLSPKKEDRLYHSDGPFEMTSAYHEFTFNKNLSQILKLSYNPELPSFFTNPSSVRLSYWTRFEEGRESMPKLWEFLDGSQFPIIARGHEIVENTPDLNTGGYYRYGLDRTLILTKYQGNNLLISLSKQTEVSEVGKKGLVLGSDDDWNYLYSGKKGLNKSGLGWVKSHMYDSFSAVVYYEIPGEAPQVKCGVFKWLNAGWRKINMVKEHHIHRGLLRYADAFKAVVENPTLPELSVMVDTIDRIRTMDIGNLQQVYLSYLQSFREDQADNKALTNGWVADIVSDAQVEKMDPREIRAAIILDYIKSLLGKPHYIDPTML